MPDNVNTSKNQTPSKNHEFMLDSEDHLQEILEQPDDDRPRLAYAKWLDLQRNPLGNFIRLQCALKTNLGAVRRGLTAMRMRYLMFRYRSSWLRDLPRYIHHPRFQRGLIADVTLEGVQVFNDHADEIFKLAPIQFVTIVSPPNRRDLTDPHAIATAVIPGFGLAAPSASRFFGLAEAFQNSKITTPKVDARSLDEDKNLEIFARCPQLSKLRGISLSSSVSDDGVCNLAESCHLSRLTRLLLQSNDIGDDGAKKLAVSRRFPNLSFLDLSENRITEFGAEALAAAYLRNPRFRLRLVGNCIGRTVQQSLRARFGTRFVT